MAVNASRRGLLLAGAAILAGCDRLRPARSASFHGTDITGVDFGRELRLPDQDGRERTLADFKGKVTVIFFGYTQCPDVCPTTMLEIAEAKKALGPDGERVQGVFITVDPERDTPQLLKAYLSGFDPGFIGLRGSPEQTAAVAKEFKVFYAKVPGKAEGSYTMDHSAGAYVLDTEGRLRLMERYGAGAEALKADLKTLLDAG